MTLQHHHPQLGADLPVTADLDRKATPRERRTLVATGMGNALEWFDWGIYSAFAIYFATEIFNPEDPLSALLGVMGVFAVGFLARPVGGWLFGWLSDNVGRRASMLSTVGLASVGSLLIAAVPTYANAGVWAAIILLTARLLQGLAHGGEMPSAQTYIAETAPAKRRGLWSSMIYVSGTIGIVAGMLMGVILNAILPGDIMHAWGWRIPFVIGGLLGLAVMFSRSRMHETEAFAASKTGERAPMFPEVRKHWRSALRVIGLGVGGTVCYYVWAVSAVQQAVVLNGMDQGAALLANLLSNVVLIIALPFWGRFSDKFGRRAGLVIGTGVPMLLFAPMQAMVSSSFLSLFIPAAVILFFMGATLSILPAVFAEMFPTRIRTIGVAIPYAVAVALFGGTAPYLQTFLGARFGPATFNIYVITLLLISTVVALTLPESKGKDLTKE
ncbi:MFS transporter [Paeniglutamicibacter cryotolerans]|uniref:MHS family alpha-ketoglutarate permease-like MFS transporter n=1 Tax=Paeniglutamicibacter cryotolerans TaxID=670079 RepID=A0A839QFR9_9MICC|nr:MFS transporter [Paeniglutamicibacter cryotolerans]MBB2994507.1 MHS family alpha-ketoglutarate permease-like MFS transporter [Paeniglutamicibacter cryotolerans]